MNYRHAFKAGNAADVLKHVVLLALLRRLQHKPAPLTYIETHAGRGRYELGHEMAQKTGDYLRGIARLWPARNEAELPPLLGDYLKLVAEFNPAGELAHYPGSPRIARAVLRPDDRMIVCELHPDDAAALQAEFRRDAQVAVHRRDGYEALGALLPPTPRRGLCLIDPPYERPDEFAAALAGITAGRQRWPQACFALWYPIKGPLGPSLLHAAVLRSGLREVLCVELLARPARDPDVLSGSGLLLFDPPWQIDQVLQAALPELARRLEDEPGSGRARVDWLVGP
jgi:23S rRNA (adenine2030-N6)-methyltransferase